ncbi:MAG: hypothetical protein JSS82_06640 [Bacteroidetes bacterium]|nr:hypothetical protein [Bacteroidota bacterium]
MEKRFLGIILTLLGAAGLVTAGINFMNNNATTHNIKSVIVFGVIGAVFFAAGIGLVRNTKDVVKNNERIS